MKETLKKSEELNKHTKDVVTNYIYTVRMEAGKPVETIHSEACFNVTGYTSQEFRDNSYLWLDMIVEEDRNIVQQQADDVISGKLPLPINHRLVKKDGIDRWVESTVVPNHDINGNINSYSGVIHDITERKRVEEELSHRTRLNQALIDNMPCIALILKKGTREIVACNKVAKDYGAVVGQTCFGSITKKDSPCHFCLAPELWGDNKQREVEVDYMDIVWEGNWLPLSEDLYLHYIYNVPEHKKSEKALKESEKRFRTLFEQAGVGVAQIVSETGKFVRINKKYCDIVGYSEEELEKLTFQEITHPDDLKVDLDNKQLLIEGKISEFSVEKRYVHKNGSIVWVNLTISPMWKVGEKPNYHIAIVEDITERKHLEKSVLEIEERERQRIGSDLHDEVGQLLTGISFKIKYVESSLKKKSIPEAEEVAIITSLITQVKEQTRLLARGLFSVKDGEKWPGLFGQSGSIYK